MTTTTSPTTTDASDELSRIGAEIACVGSLIGQAQTIDHPAGLEWPLHGWSNEIDALAKAGTAMGAQS